MIIATYIIIGIVSLFAVAVTLCIVFKAGENDGICDYNYKED